jgi:hypothetical protein
MGEILTTAVSCFVVTLLGIGIGFLFLTVQKPTGENISFGGDPSLT